MTSLPEIIAHRGTPRVRRENTLPAFEEALAQGADGVELDVHATADGVVVVHHDAVLPETVEPARLIGMPIAALSFEELRGATLPEPGGASRTEIPTLRQVADVVGGRGTLYVEIKGAGIEHATLDVLENAGADFAVHGFDHRVSRRVADASSVPTGILVDSYLLDPVHALRAAGARDYWCQWQFIDRELVERVHAAGGRVVAWTVNDVAAARRLAALGVDAVCTDVPGTLRDQLGGDA